MRCDEGMRSGKKKLLEDFKQLELYFQTENWQLKKKKEKEKRRPFSRQPTKRLTALVHPVASFTSEIPNINHYLAHLRK